MALTTSSINIIKPVLAIFWILFGFTPVKADLTRQNLKQNQKPNSSTSTATKKPKSSQSESAGTANAPKGGGSRPPCPDIQPTLTALVPLTKQQNGITIPFGKTTSANPTLWIYVPYKSQTITFSKFSLLQGDNPIYEKTLRLTGTPGIISIPIPSTAPPLENGKLYEMKLSLFVRCTTSGTPVPGVVQAWVTKDNSSTTFSSKLPQATSQQKVMLYAKEGFWYEALTTAAELKRTNPNDDNWVKLLQQFDLKDFVETPISKCCNIQN